MTDELIVKRLHVSGLTPTITPADLSQKLGSFGTVKALDGFGKLDALGQPRKFGYVTIETTKGKLARCMNLLSGVTWKGGQLRLGEAKPDFRERLAKERQAAEAGEPPRKKRRLPRGVQGVHASDMSLVTPENVKDRGGWKVTPLGRIVKPIRMRPVHPLPEPLTSAASPSKVKKKGKGKGDAAVPKKKRVKEPPTRARRRTIDPLKWDSTQLKGVFLENAGAVVTGRPNYPAQMVEEDAGEEASEDDESEEESVMEPGMDVVEEAQPTDAPDKEGGTPVTAIAVASPIAHVTKTPLPLSKPSVPSTNKSIEAPVATVTAKLLQEKDAALGLLQSLFGGRDDDDWADRESIGSDIEMEESSHVEEQGKSMASGFEEAVDEVPLDVVPTRHVQEPVESPEATETAEESRNVTSVATSKPKLKDLFASQEETAGFSLLGHLDLDLELDDDALDLAFAPTLAYAQPAIVETMPAQVPDVTSDAKSHARLTLDPSLPLFFPLSDDARASVKGRVKDPFDVARDRGLDWRTFCRTQTSEEIKQRWESQKVELTKDWKRRHREAIKSRRRRGGGDGE